MFANQKDVDRILLALGEHLDAAGQGMVDLLVCGGSALNALNLVSRTTKDVDVLAIVQEKSAGLFDVISAEPLPPHVVDAARKVARDFGLTDHWLNGGPTSAVQFGLPVGIVERAQARRFGRSLTIRFLSRYDQIHFKVYAAADQAGKHYEDLLNLNPTPDELEAAARWSMTHDVSDGYRKVLKEMLTAMGHDDVAQRI